MATPLMVAVDKGHTKVVEMLIAYGANINHMAVVSLLYSLYTSDKMKHYPIQKSINSGGQ